MAPTLVPVPVPVPAPVPPAAGSRRWAGVHRHAGAVDLSELEPHVRASWSAGTCDPVDLPWSAADPSRGQCGVTALVLHDLLGGELLVAEVTYADGGQQGWHTWNRLPDGTVVDLTREQFAPHELVGAPRAVVRPPGPPGRCLEQYVLLRDAVAARLAAREQPRNQPGDEAVARSRRSPRTGRTSGTRP